METNFVCTDITRLQLLHVLEAWSRMQEASRARSMDVAIDSYSYPRRMHLHIRNRQ